MKDYVAGIWEYRYFWLSLVRLDLRTKYRGTVMGIGWTLLRPISLAAILCLVFHKVFHADVREYGPFLMAGLACWNFLSGVTHEGCHSFFRSESYIRQRHLPLAIYPLRTTLTLMIHFLIALACVIVLAWSLNRTFHVLALVSLLPGLALTFAFGWSLASLAALANVFFRDTQHLCEVGFQLLFYATPIVYRPQMLHDNQLSWLVQFNPFVVFLELIRDPILHGSVPSVSNYVTGAVVVLLFGSLAATLSLRLQQKVIFHL